MRKRVTFVEHLKKESLLKNGSGHILMRSAESNKSYMEGLECSPGQQGRKMCRGTHTHVPAGGQHMKTIHVSKSVMSAPFLQQPALTSGQRRLLCSIANVYSTEHMRRQMKQHYLSVLHSCVQSGQSPSCRRGHQRGDSSTLTQEAGKDVEARAKPQGQRKGSSSSSSSTANPDVILPKIVNRGGM